MKIEIKLKPWMTPNFVIAETPPRPRQEGMKESPSWPLAEVDAETLAEMCDGFRAEIFWKAGKSDPRQNVPALAQSGGEKTKSKEKTNE